MSFRYVDDLGPLKADGTWWAAVDTSWRYDGFDRTAARTEVAVRFRAAEDGGDAVVGAPPAHLSRPVSPTGASA